MSNELFKDTVVSFLPLFSVHALQIHSCNLAIQCKQSILLCQCELLCICAQNIQNELTVFGSFISVHILHTMFMVQKFGLIFFQNHKPFLCMLFFHFFLQVLTSQQMSALTSLTVGKGGGTTATPLSAHQFIHLTGGTQGTSSTVSTAQGGSQTIHTQIALQKPAGSSGQTFQFHPLHLKQGAVATSALAGTGISTTKPKIKKRGGTTPPKSQHCDEGLAFFLSL